MQFAVTENLDKALRAAKAVAIKFSNPEIGTEHILYGILSLGNGLAAKLLVEARLKTAYFEEIFAEDDHVVMLEPEFTDRVKQTFIMAYKVCRASGEHSISPEHMLFALLADPTSRACFIIKQVAKGDLVSMREKLAVGFNKGASSEGEFNENGSEIIRSTLPSQLSEIGSDITRKVYEQKTDPVIGRKDEIERIIEILCRKSKNNPVLIGEPGVGKTAVIEGLAKAIVDGSVPELLKDKIVYSLDIGSLVAGTKYRGALEEKLKTAIDLIKRAGNIIVFIDELHTLAQASNKEGEVSPSDILKPYLARGELQTIGATTTDEYRKYIEKDKALERRFQPIIVNPPSVEETIEILKGIQENYEAFHKVRISHEALVAAAKLSDRYIADRFLPDKAIDLIDEAMSRAKIGRNTIPQGLKEFEIELESLEQAKQEAVKKEDYALASKLRTECDALRKKIDETKLKWSKDGERSDTAIAPDDIAAVVAKWTKIPVTRLTETESERLIRLEKILEKRVIGQEKAVSAVSKAIRRARAGLKDIARPIGTFLFLGPTGVGKTELTKALSEAMFDDETAIVRLDMSEYMESHSVSKLIGAPPGYVGFEDGGQLTEQVRRKPYSVVLFDEIEKAHPDITNALLQIMDDGRLTDSQGRVVSFKNTIIIMTSNVGADSLKKSKSLGFGEANAESEDNRVENAMMNALKKSFKPEFINRIDVVCIFKQLTKEQIGSIADILLNKVAKNLTEHNIKLMVTDKAKEHLIDKGYDPEYGARPLRRVIQSLVEDGIAESLLVGKIKKGNTAIVDFIGDEIVIK
ncbi:MAG: ATP-dependent Clp protease ATP-binding subunit [Firmicutes bacterium]|nr:ATP-dependent Clp protease ATP-binding subunit [Bacillota bacterium]